MVVFWQIMVCMNVFRQILYSCASYTAGNNNIDANRDFFQLFFIDTLLTAVVTETNRYVR